MHVKNKFVKQKKDKGLWGEEAVGKKRTRDNRALVYCDGF